MSANAYKEANAMATDTRKSRTAPPRPALKRPTGEHVLQGVVGLYVRVSRKGDREDDRFHSPREQAERAAALAAAKGYVPGPVFEDIDVSGATAPDKRPAMLDLLGRIDAGELAGIAAFSLDRLSREPAHGDSLVKRVTKAGGVILTPDIPDAIDSPTGEFTFGMLLQVAKLYRSQAGARFATAKERAIRAGLCVGPTPVGYRQGSDLRMEVDPELAPVIRSIFEQWAAGTAGRSVLAAQLEAATGRPWSRQAVPAIIKRRLYATGRLEYGELVSEHDAGAIVDEALWHAAQRAPAPRRESRSGGRWLLTGLLKCDGCGYNLTPHTTRAGGPTRYRYYRCQRRECTAKAMVNADRVERWVAIESMRVEHELERLASSPDLGALEAGLAAAERRLEQVLAPEAQDALGDAWASTAKARRQERDAAAAELGEARQESGVEARTFDLKELVEGRELDPEGLRTALAWFWKAIHVGRRVKGEGTPLTLVSRGSSTLAEMELTTYIEEEAA